jgi:hypothetical protein
MRLQVRGSWWLRSPSDPRWDCNGDTEACGGFVMPRECEQAIARLKQRLGEKPADLEYGYMKD